MRISDWSSDVCSSDLRWKRRARSLVALLLLAGMAWAAWIWRPVPPVRLPLVHVIDGDSLTLQRDGETLMIRLTGLDAVEYRQDCARADRSEEHTSELQSLMRISYAVFFLQKKNKQSHKMYSNNI